MGVFKKIAGSYSARELKKINRIVDEIEALDGEMQALSDVELRAKTGEFMDRYYDGETLDMLLPEAFAAVREAAWRVLGMKPFRVQLIGGVVLYQGRIAEMKTGEGKTLVAVLPVYLNALKGDGVHVVTVNEYLAKRDSDLMGKVYRFMGLSVGLITSDMETRQRQAAYNCDITYGTGSEFGFDYLRDNMETEKRYQVQRGHSFALVDEVDSILIDDARTPLILSGPGDESSDMYTKVDAFVKTLHAKRVKETDSSEQNDESGQDENVDYIVEEKARTVNLTEQGIAKAEAYFGLDNLSDISNTALNHHILMALQAYGLMRRDIEYIIRNDEVLIVDVSTGRVMDGRRFSDGLHQAIEAKEGVSIRAENKTIATVTYQNYFRMYDKLSGMSGTAATESEEFGNIYHLDIVEIPTNRPVIRNDLPDMVYKTEAGKLRAVISKIQDCHERHQPVLIGTSSVEKSEQLSRMLDEMGITHTVLNAKNAEVEAKLIAQAGKLDAVTVATNMAGRGTDILLGGNAEYLAVEDLRKAGYSYELIDEAIGYADTKNQDVLAVRERYHQLLREHKQVTDAEGKLVSEVGGLCVIGTERHESRRIDNQLRGRAGRQGDPGESQFFVSLEDDTMRLFGSHRIIALMDSLNINEDTPLDPKMLSGAIENAQKTIESRNYQIRKNVLEFDDVVNVQRNVIYNERQRVLDGLDVSGNIQQMIKEFIDLGMESYLAGNVPDSQEQLNDALEVFEGIFIKRGEIRLSDLDRDNRYNDLKRVLYAQAQRVYRAREVSFGTTANGTPNMRGIERFVLLNVVDRYWTEQLDLMLQLKDSVMLEGYANVKPIDRYRVLGHELFEQMVLSIHIDVVRELYTLNVTRHLI